MNHRRWVYAACCSALMWLGCESSPPSDVTAPASASGKADGRGLALGLQVVAQTGKASFRGGEVVALSPDEVTLAHGPPSAEGDRKRTTVSRTKVWRAGVERAPSKGEAALCKVEGAWLACRITSPEARMVQAQDPFGSTHRLTLEQLAQVDEEARAELDAYLTREAEHRTFDRAFLAAGRPSKPKGWAPSAGDKVVAHFVGTSWYGAEVVSVRPDKNKVRIDWEGDTFETRDVPLEDVVPQPSGASAVEEQQFVLLRPERSDQRWEPHRVKKRGAKQIQLVDRDGEERSVTADELIVVTASS